MLKAGKWSMRRTLKILDLTYVNHLYHMWPINIKSYFSAYSSNKKLQ